MRTYIPAVVVQMSPFVGDDGAAPWGRRILGMAVVAAGAEKYDAAVTIPVESTENFSTEAKSNANL
jgi:hypothetical protein